MRIVLRQAVLWYIVLGTGYAVQVHYQLQTTEVEALLAHHAMQQSIDSLRITVAQWEALIQPLQEAPRTRVTVSFYQAVREQTDSTPDLTSSMTRIQPERAGRYKALAVSHDLLKPKGFLRYGDWVMLVGAGDRDGFYQVYDTMNRRWNQRVDILESLAYSDSYLHEDVLLFRVDPATIANVF